jgi:superfamily II DNA or RNA helicase
MIFLSECIKGPTGEQIQFVQDMSQVRCDCVIACEVDNSNNQGQTIKKPRTQEEIQHRKEAAERRLELMTGLRPIQKDVLLCLKSTEHSSLVVIPTGSGKTLLISLLACNTKCSVVFAPYTLLKNQLYSALNEKGATRFWPLGDSSESLDLIVCSTQYMLISYEAASTCACLLLALSRINRLGPIFVDEVQTYTLYILRLTHIYIYIHVCV